MILLLSAEGNDQGLLDELARSGQVGRIVQPGLVGLEADKPPNSPAALARQCLVAAEEVSAPSVSAWARLLFERVLAGLPEGEPWRLHVHARYGGQSRARMGARAWHSVGLRGVQEQRRAKPPRPEVAAGAGEHRSRLIEEALRGLLKDRRRIRLRTLTPDTSPYTAADGLVQLVLTSPEAGWLSVLPAPRVFEHRRWISTFPAGEVEVEADPAPPSRAFAKLVEAQCRLGRTFSPGESCVDLGASPGGWSWVALQQGARVIAVDRSPLRADLMGHPRLTFVHGDAFSYQPPAPVDWLLCDVIAAPERTIAGLLDALRRGWADNFVATLKLRGPADHPTLDVLKRELPGLAAEWFLTQLCANKGEVCVYGRRGQSTRGITDNLRAHR